MAEARSSTLLLNHTWQSPKCITPPPYNVAVFRQLDDMVINLTHALYHMHAARPPSAALDIKAHAEAIITNSNLTT